MRSQSTSPFLLIAAILVLVAGCGKSPTSGVGQVGTSPDVRADAVAGYVHTLARSRFDVGSPSLERDEFGMHKVIGSLGTFATQDHSHAATALPNTPVPSDPRNVFPGDPDAHNAAVVAYFTEAGLPARQIASTSAVGTGVDSIAPEGALAPIVAASFSVLHRTVNAVPVEDSTAWALLGADSSSLEEQVFWPELPARVIDDALKFKEMLASDAAVDFFARLPGEAAAGSVVIHHTSLSWQGTFDAQVCFLADLAGTKYHFDIDGNILQLPDELAAEFDGGLDGGLDSGFDAAPISCATREAGSTAELPAGTCSGSGACIVEQVVTCSPGVKYIPASPIVFSCDCLAGNWRCDKLAGGGFGLLPCDDAGL